MFLALTLVFLKLLWSKRMSAQADLFTWAKGIFAFIFARMNSA